jgi:hypothetical protein
MADVLSSDEVFPEIGEAVHEQYPVGRSEERGELRQEEAPTHPHRQWGLLRFGVEVLLVCPSS